MSLAYEFDDRMTDMRLFDRVRTRRVLAYFVDLAVISMVMLAYCTVLLVLGFLTFGATWLLLFIFWPTFVVTGIIYSVLTLGSRASATIGMRLFGLELRRLDGAYMTPVSAGIHSVLFYVSISILSVIALIVPLFSDRKRMLHDLVLGTVVVNRL